METTRCPECGQPAEVVDRAVLESTDGPVEHAHVRCVQRHRFWLPVGYLTREPRRAGVREGAVGGGLSGVEGGAGAATSARVLAGGRGGPGAP